MPENRRSIRFAIHAPQSADTPADSSSCDAQFAVCRDFAKATDEPDLSWCSQRFDDQGYSGATLDRPALRRLRKVIDLGGIDRVYAVALDRLSRRLRDTIALLNELDRRGVELRLVHQPELGRAAESRFLRHILASFAEFEREMIATRIAETRAYLKQHGRRLAEPVPFGYDADPDRKQLLPSLIEARRDRAIFKRAAAGQTPAQIARRINHPGWRTKRWVSRRPGRTVAGGRPPCRGVQYPAAAVEQFSRDLLTQPNTWRQVLDSGPGFGRDQAAALRAVWQGLDILSQERLLPQIVERVEFRRRNSVARVTFNPRLAEIRRRCK